MRALLTGASGFVGPYVAEALRRLYGADVEIVATALKPGQHQKLGSVMALDITDRDGVAAMLRATRPTHLIHLAGVASPAAANSAFDTTWQVHLHGTLNLARAIMRYAPECWLINIGSGMVYGASASSGRALDESTLLAPIDEYSSTKAAADLALGALTKSGLKCIRLRPFNHTGPGQTENFVVPAFAAQIARIEAGLAPTVMRVGNLEAERDFLDVRDVAEAYARVAGAAERLQPGTIFNIASGIRRRISEILDELIAASRVKISVESDPMRRQPIDIPIMIGDAGRARALLGWQPEHPFDDTLLTVLNDCRARVNKMACSHASAHESDNEP